MAKKKSDSETQEKRPKNPMPAQHQKRPGIEAKNDAEARISGAEL
jgi:hypothetical protein